MSGETNPSPMAEDPAAEKPPEKPRRVSFWRWAFRLGLVCLLVAALAFGLAAYYIKDQFERAGPLQAETHLVVERGESVSQIAAKLADHGIIRNADVFRIGVRVLDGGRDLKAGEFAFAPGWSMREVMDHLRSGETVLHRLTIPEGLTSQDVVDILRATDNLGGEINAVPSEGSLLPETYYFSLGDSRQSLIARMADNMAERLAALWEKRVEGLPIDNPQQALVLASIVERETGEDDERALVAGVFINRLHKGMRLQSDPTVVYGLSNGTGEIGRPLTRKDLKTAHPYNTYVIKGLPPGPIANPGEESLAAVMAPAETDYLYFVADGTGGHAFAKTLAEHNKNVAKWRQFQKQQNQQ